jgi:5-methylcytosine-specific restriction endonuclease McrA
MEYLYRTNKKKYVAHIWMGDDTACTMWSTGGLKKNRKDWVQGTDIHGRRICQSCAHAIAKKVKRKTKTVQKKKMGKQKAFLTSWEWRTLRYEVLLKHGRRCMCCGASPDDGRTVIHVDHIKPRFRYPELALSEDNLQVLCGVCNQGKGAWDETDFRENRTEYDEHIENVVQIELARQAKESQ